MKSLVVYFSQTSSTQKIAYAIHRGISHKVEKCDIMPLKGVTPGDLDKYDLIGLGSPVWQDSPPNLKRFIKSLPRYEGKHIFCFCTHGTGGVMFFPTVGKLLTERGFTVIGFRDWYGSNHIPCFPSPYMTDGHPDEIDLKEAAEFGEEMVDLSQRITAGETQLIPPIPDIPVNHAPPPSTPLQPGRSAHGQKIFDREKCNYPNCHICIDNCPLDCIDMSASQPVPEVCEGGCVFCDLICPTGAIHSEDLEYGLEHLHANVWIFEQDLAKAEATGHFRRLIPKDKVGWDTPYYKVHSKHPRFKIPKEPGTDTV